MPKLYELADQYEEVLARSVDPETGDITEEALAALDAIEEPLREKALNVVAYLKGERAEAASIRQEASRLEARAARHERRAEWLEEYVRRSIEPSLGHEELSDSRSEITWRRSRAVEIDAGAELPEQYLRRKPPPPPAPDKTKIREALDAGEPVPGARVVERWRMRVR